ncbi:MAG: DNA/RNA non-specific endonuclease, partial [Acidobacteriota bacterium]
AGLPSPWGDLDKEEAVETTCSARLPGQWADAESGLSYNRFRYYAPWRMQYLSQDPLRSVQSPGPYAYPTDPVQVIDPLGLLAEVLYGDPDGLGRPTGATAVITPADISTGTEANSTIRPPGFEGGNHPFHHERGHLIGNQLGGDGNDPRNLVTLTGGTNHPHMESLEAQVRAHVEAGNFVEVRVTPIYEGDQLVPSRVKYEATDLATGNKIVDTEVENGQHKNYKACQH